MVRRITETLYLDSRAVSQCTHTHVWADRYANMDMCIHMHLVHVVNIHRYAAIVYIHVCRIFVMKYAVISTC